MTTEIPSPKTAIESNTQALGALKVSLTNSHEKLNLDLISIVEGEITAARTNQNNKSEDEVHQLEFRLGRQVWSEAATLNKADSPNLTLSLVNKERPKPDSRVSRRWPNSRLHPIAARIRNDLAAGQLAICSVEDISIGGAKLTVSKDHLFLTGQTGEIEIDYPLQKTNSVQKVAITAVRYVDDYQVLHIRFAPITDSHIQSIAQHLIRFEWTKPISELELDLSHTSWPSERITTTVEEKESEIKVNAQIEGESLCEIQAVISGKLVEAHNVLLDPRWREEDQLISLLSPLVKKLQRDTRIQELHILGQYGFLRRLGFENNKEHRERWELKIDSGEFSAAKKLHSTGTRPIYSQGLEPKNEKRKANVSWDDYGLVYDKMCAVNSSYKHLLEGYKQWLEELDSDVNHAVDVGAGTGNFVIEAAQSLATTDIVHIDQDIIMNLFAQSKYRARELNNVRILTSAIESATFEDSSLDLVTAVHSIYTVKDPNSTLSEICRWLKPGGYFYIVDISRTIDTNEWSKHIFFETAKERGYLSTARYFWDARKAISANKKIEATQNSGGYWTKTHEQFRKTLENSGFSIERSEVTYRGNSDLAICRKN